MEQARHDAINARSIDEAVHWLAKSKLRDLHGEILTLILEKSNAPQVKPLELSFEQLAAQRGGGGYYQ